MKSLKMLPLLLLLWLFQGVVIAQDAIVKTNNDTIYASVKEVGTEEITYMLAEIPNGPTFKISRGSVAEIIFSNGTVVKIDGEQPRRLGDDDRKNIIGMDILGLSQTNVTVWYERRIVNNWLGIKVPISYGWPSYNYYDYLFQTGVQLKAFFNRKSLVRGYFGPEILAGVIRNDEGYYNYDTDEWIYNGDNHGYIGFMPVIGFCVQPHKRIYMDFDCGAGIGRKFDKDIDFRYDNRIIPWKANMSLGVKF
ncbi:MAG: hypothetical protein K1X55_13520 [Chitinophagales bacterium]|nr:hypothetical protein [Chitinophagales bacterium]